MDLCWETHGSLCPLFGHIIRTKAGGQGKYVLCISKRDRDLILYIHCSAEDCFMATVYELRILEFIVSTKAEILGDYVVAFSLKIS